ncbi:MAG: SAM-dependent methyltransferase [Legionella sp.]|uniref:SAM-dependent methyltransferase n=1 Tax=Legionella sp. TaxID=459 RepID=UPI0028444EF8|nr:SAM-dependent methyltransferase [Legionella sp.]
MSQNDLGAANHVRSSYRDPCSQIYKREHVIFRQFSSKGIDAYKKLMQSGLYDLLQSKHYLIPHEEVSLTQALDSHAEAVIRPEQIKFISYPYEWCFSQLKDAALLTLEIARLALEHGMILKDASAYNVQFHHGKPIFIDTGSFDIYEEGMLWPAYKQFCMHFLAPLALMAKKDLRLGLLTKEFSDGIPLDLASQLLPFKSKCSVSLYTHIHLHAKAQKKYHDTKKQIKGSISKMGLFGILSNLSSAVKRLKISQKESEWSDYYQNTNYSDKAHQHKIDIVRELTEKVKPRAVWDLGGNDGFYSHIAAQTGADVITFDSDVLAIEQNYLRNKRNKKTKLLPLLQNLVNPSTMMGWGQSEREGLKERGEADLVIALALIHHIAISHHIPFHYIAEYFSSLGRTLLIEFVAKDDTQVQRLLRNRVDIFDSYHIEQFKNAFSKYYEIKEEIPIAETCRTIFLMEQR